MPYRLNHELLKQARLKRGWSQQELSDASGVPQQTIAAWEVGRHGDCYAASLFAVAEALKLPPDEVMVFVGSVQSV